MTKVINKPMPSTHEFGFTTIASKNLIYAEMAVDMALSLRDFHDEPICLLADELCEDHVIKNYPGVFDLIAKLPPRYDKVKTNKFALAEAVPFERAVFIDADTIVLDQLESLISQTKLYQIFMMGSFLPADTDKSHHQISIRSMIKAFKLDRFFTNHNAAFGYQRTYALGFLEDCFRVHVNELDKPKWRLRGFIGDELAFGIIAGRLGMTIMESPFPVLWSHELADFKPGTAPKPLCHFHDQIPEVTLDWLMEGVDRRRTERGFALGSTDIWRAKDAKTAKVFRYKNWLNMLFRKIS